MNVWVLDGLSGVKLLYKSFGELNLDEDIVSGFLTAFHHFSMKEFKQTLDSIEMGGLRWIYIQDTKYNLLFVAADDKNEDTEILKGRLGVIGNSFIREFKSIYEERGNTWDGDINIFLPFLREIESYYIQWEQVENVSIMAEFFDLIGVFQHLLILLRKIIEERMYSKSRTMILEDLEVRISKLNNRKEFKGKITEGDITFSKEDWFDTAEMNLIKYNKLLVIEYFQAILIEIVEALKMRGKNLCLKYFNEGGVFEYLYTKMKFLKYLDLDKFLLDLFLLLKE